MLSKKLAFRDPLKVNFQKVGNVIQHVEKVNLQKVENIIQKR